jgi:Zn-dependent M32 family carboxypeptidase|tara:strand:- start:237 stop:542 length:306 start_codon:yes stop_codon:yes gene_type:complete
MTNYTTEQVKIMVEKYNQAPSRETVEELAAELNKSTKSIIGKLAREGVYQKAVYVSKTGESPITKVEIVRQLAEKLEIDCERLSGLEKSPKGVLKLLCENI